MRAGCPRCGRGRFPWIASPSPARPGAGALQRFRKTAWPGSVRPPVRLGPGRAWHAPAPRLFATAWPAAGRQRPFPHGARGRTSNRARRAAASVAHPSQRPASAPSRWARLPRIAHRTGSDATAGSSATKVPATATAALSMLSARAVSSPISLPEEWLTRPVSASSSAWSTAPAARYDVTAEFDPDSLPPATCSAGGANAADTKSDHERSTHPSHSARRRWLARNARLCIGTTTRPRWWRATAATAMSWSSRRHTMGRSARARSRFAAATGPLRVLPASAVGETGALTSAGNPPAPARPFPTASHSDVSNPTATLPALSAVRTGPSTSAATRSR